MGEQEFYSLYMALSCGKKQCGRSILKHHPVSKRIAEALRTDRSLSLERCTSSEKKGRHLTLPLIACEHERSPFHLFEESEKKIYTGQKERSSYLVKDVGVCAMLLKELGNLSIASSASIQECGHAVL